jgi:hypothetical protein
MAWKAKGMPVTSLQLVPPLIVPADPDFGAIAEHVDDAVAVSRSAGTEPDAVPEEPTAGTAEPSEQPRDDKSAADGEPAPTSDLASVCSYE